MSHFEVKGNEAKRSCKLVNKHKTDMRWDEQAIQRVKPGGHLRCNDALY